MTSAFQENACCCAIGLSGHELESNNEFRQKRCCELLRVDTRNLFLGLRNRENVLDRQHVL